jgi:O-antigen/teichoic acid export membrane protein
MALACLIAFAASAAAMLFVIACKAPIARWFNTEQSSSWLYYVPLMILLSGCYGALNYWNNRRKNFARLSANRVLKSVVSSGANVGLGFAGAGSSGLIHGSVLGQACTTGLFGFQAWREEKSLRAALTFGAMRRQAIRYRDFPKYLVASGLVEAGAGQVPIILFSSLFGAAALGYFSLAMRLVSLPMGLIAESIRDVFRQTASEHFASYGTCRPVFMQTCRRLLLLSVLPFSIILLFGPFLFAFVFGDQWRPSGAHAQIMVPMLFLRFVSSPLSSTFYIAEKQKWDFALQGIFFAAIVAALAVVSFYTRKPAAAVITYTSVYSLKYIIEFFLSYRFSLGSTHRVRA